jgi:hypothetical protein
VITVLVCAHSDLINLGNGLFQVSNVHVVSMTKFVLQLIVDNGYLGLLRNVCKTPLYCDIIVLYIVL